MKKTLVFFCFLLVHNILLSQENDSTKTRVGVKISSGIGLMNIGKYSSAGIAVVNGVDFAVKDWLFLSANLHIAKSGNNKTQFTYLKYFPDFPENIETNFYETNVKGTTMNSFSSIGFYALLNPGRINETRIIFGPGICFVSWEEISTNFLKNFRHNEYIGLSNIVTNRKKLDLGIQITLERDVAKKIYMGLKFQGYLGEESASSFFATIGFRLY